MHGVSTFEELRQRRRLRRRLPPACATVPVRRLGAGAAGPVRRLGAAGGPGRHLGAAGPAMPLPLPLRSRASMHPCTPMLVWFGQLTEALRHTAVLQATVCPPTCTVVYPVATAAHTPASTLLVLVILLLLCRNATTTRTHQLQQHTTNQRDNPRGRDRLTHRQSVGVVIVVVTILMRRQLQLEVVEVGRHPVRCCKGPWDGFEAVPRPGRGMPRHSHAAGLFGE